jgi:hypothetical protein
MDPFIIVRNYRQTRQGQE